MSYRCILRNCHSRGGGNLCCMQFWIPVFTGMTGLLRNTSYKLTKYKIFCGQALITLIFYVIIIVTVTTAAVMLIAINSLSATKLQEGVLAYYVAEGGAENGFLRVLRDPNYLGETNLIIGDGSADIVVTPGNPKTIVATGKLGNFVRKMQITATYTNGVYTITSWKEIP